MNWVFVVSPPSVYGLSVAPFVKLFLGLAKVPRAVFFLVHVIIFLSMFLNSDIILLFVDLATTRLGN